MHDLQRDFLEIVTQIRSHLEYQRTLGVRHIGLSAEQPAATEAAPLPERAPDRAPRQSGAPLRPSEEAPCSLPATNKGMSGCTRCALSAERTAVVSGEGKADADLVFVGDAPEQEEDGRGRPFTGQTAQLLTDIIVKGMNLKPGAVYVCTIATCLPPAGRAVRQEEIEACEARFRDQIGAMRPRVIVALGERAAQTLLKTKENISAFRGRWHSYHGVPLMATFSPAHLVDHPGDKKFTWADIKLVMAKLGLTVTKG